MMPQSLPTGPNLESALAYAAAGMAVFPCHPERKSPLVRRGFKDATTDQAQIRAWWGHWPLAVVGLPTGQKNGRWVLDIDVGGKGGDDSLYALEMEHGELPETPMAITASGGRHYHFRWPADRRVVTRTGVWPGIDVRGDGGYVIAPRSVGTRGSWEWEGSADPEDGVELADAPDWLLDAVCERKPSAVPPAQDADRTGPLPSRADVESALGVLDPDGGYDLWISIGMSLHASGAPWAFEAWDQWSARGTSYSGGDSLRAKWGSFKDDPSRRRGIGTLFALAKEAGWSRPVNRVEGPQQPSPPIEAYSADGRALIQVRSGELPQVVDDAEHYLIESGVGIFQHGTRLVRVGAWDQGTGAIHRPHGSGVLIDIGPEWLSDAMGRVIRWERWDARKGEMKRTDCPSKVATTLLSRSGSWRFPSLVGFCDSPTLDQEGRVIDRPGYDASSGLYLTHPPSIRAIGDTDRHLAEGAGETLYEAVSTFPFVSEADRSACLSMILTALMRRLLPSAPIGCVSANTPGTGKSKLVDVVSAIATGRKAAVVGIGSTPEETEKRVDSVLLKGDTVCSFDNVDRAVKSDVLCQVSTQAVKSIRVMGLSKIVEAPTNVALMMTGNNLTLVGDLVRRCVVVNLDAGCERPELRECDGDGRPFRDAVGYVLKHRSELIRAALVLSKAYLDAGCPRVDAPPFGSFEEWDRMVRRPLIWAGWPDPLSPAEAMREQDHELMGMRNFLRYWMDACPHPVTSAELSSLVRERVPRMADDWAPKFPDLQDAAVQVMGDLNKWGARELGYRLRAMAGRMFDGRRIVKAPRQAGGLNGWRVESVE